MRLRVPAPVPTAWPTSALCRSLPPEPGHSMDLSGASLQHGTTEQGLPPRALGGVMAGDGHEASKASDF